jgi:hypothetical protein
VTRHASEKVLAPRKGQAVKPRRPRDFVAEDDLRVPDPTWLAATGDESAAAVARVQWRAVQAVLSAAGDGRTGPASLLAEGSGGGRSQLAAKLRGTTWLQPHDLLLWAGLVPGLNADECVRDQPGLPPRWAALTTQPSAGPREDLVGADWQAVVSDLAVLLHDNPVPSLLDLSGLRLLLGRALATAGVPATRIVPHSLPGAWALAVRRTPSTAVVAVEDLLAAESDPDAWHAVVVGLSRLIDALAEHPCDERYLLVRAGPAVLDQLPWQPGPADAWPGTALHPSAHALRRLDAAGAGEPRRLVVAAAVDSGTSRLLILRVD